MFIIIYVWLSSSSKKNLYIKYEQNQNFKPGKYDFGLISTVLATDPLQKREHCLWNTLVCLQKSHSFARVQLQVQQRTNVFYKKKCTKRCTNNAHPFSRALSQIKCCYPFSRVCETILTDSLRESAVFTDMFNLSHQQ